MTLARYGVLGGRAPKMSTRFLTKSAWPGPNGLGGQTLFLFVVMALQ